MTATPGWVVILGASSGFGAAAARAFAAAGHPILGLHLDRRATLPAAEAVRRDVEAAGVRVRMLNLNAADARRRAEALDALQQEDPSAQVAVLLHSLAFGSLRPTLGAAALRVAPPHLDMTLDVMAHSLVWWTQDLLDRGLLGHGARIFALTSAGSARALPSYGPVSAAKAALEAHVRQLALELAPHGVTVNAVQPGVAETPALNAIPGHAGLVSRALATHPAGRLTTPDDVARCLVALSAPGTAWMTGNVIRVDGGEGIAG